MGWNNPPVTGNSSSYTPTTPSDWDSPVPTTYGAASDQLAARVRKLEDGTTAEIAGTALSIGTSVYRASNGKMLVEVGDYATLKDAFAGFTTTAAAADGDPVNVAGNNTRATGLSGISMGSGYYVSAGVLIAEADLVAFITAAANLTWYRFVGTGDTTTSIKQAWAEPQQVIK